MNDVTTRVLVVVVEPGEMRSAGVIVAIFVFVLFVSLFCVRPTCIDYLVHNNTPLDIILSQRKPVQTVLFC